MEKEQWQPLTDIWHMYDQTLEEAVRNGYLDDEELAESYVWPEDLDFGEWEQKDVQRYIHERMTEIVDKLRASGGGVNPNLIAGYLFRSIVCAMMWEKERIG